MKLDTGMYNATIDYNVASVLEGMHHGMTKKFSPPEMIQESEVIDPEVTLPVKWQDALDEFRKAKVLPHYFNEELSYISSL